MLKFEQIVNATGRNFFIKKSISGYYILMEDNAVYFNDSACDDVWSLEDAEAFFGNILMEDVVPEEKKYMKCGIWFLKNE